MSHITTVKIEIRDLNALETACQELGATLHLGVLNYNWYGRKIGDDPLPEGMTEEDLGKCEHVIRVPDIRYEVGVVRRSGYFTLAYDFWGNGFIDSEGNLHDGEKLKAHFGDGIYRLVDHYGAQVAMKQIRALGKTPVRKFLPNGDITVSLSA